MISPSMDYSHEGLELTERFEGCRLQSYPDPGTGADPWTIGYGHTGPDVYVGQTCTQEEAEEWLKNDIAKAVSQVNKLVNVPVSQGQFDALVDFAFNAGGTNLAHSTLLRNLNAGDYKAANDEFAKWVFAGGHKMRGLETRRLAEADEFDDDAPSAA